MHQIRSKVIEVQLSTKVEKQCVIANLRETTVEALFIVTKLFFFVTTKNNFR